MKIEDLGFNKKFIKMIDDSRKKYDLIKNEIGVKNNRTFDEWIDANIEVVTDGTFDGFNDREKYIFAYAVIMPMLNKL